MKIGPKERIGGKNHVFLIPLYTLLYFFYASLSPAVKVVGSRTSSGD